MSYIPTLELTEAPCQAWSNTSEGVVCLVDTPPLPETGGEGVGDGLLVGVILLAVGGVLVRAAFASKGT